MTKRRYIKPPESHECEWREGPPPEIGWWPANYSWLLASTPAAEVLRFYDGEYWSLAVHYSRPRKFASDMARYVSGYQYDIMWTDRWWEEK